MTTYNPARRNHGPALRTYHVNLTTLEGCEMRLKAASPAHAKRLAARAWIDEDITSWFGDDEWTIDEILSGTV